MVESTIQAQIDFSWETVVHTHHKLVVSIALKFKGRGLDLDDLIQEGYLGLRKAALRFTLNEGTQFSTYASYWIRREIRLAVLKQGRTIHVSTGVLAQINQWRRAYIKLNHEFGRAPKAEEVQKQLKIGEGTAELIQRAMLLADPLRINPYNTRYADRGSEAVENAEECASLLSVLNSLTTREQEVIRMYCGMAPYAAAMTFKEIGAVMRMNKDRPRQIYQAVLTKLSSRLRHQRHANLKAV